MKIEHVALYCRDLEKTREFFQEFFGAKAGALYRNSKGFSSYFLTFDDGARLEIMNFPDLAPDTGNGRRCGFIHLALLLSVLYQFLHLFIGNEVALYSRRFGASNRREQHVAVSYELLGSYSVEYCSGVNL